MNTATLMLHCGAKTATLEQLAAVPLPEETPSYKPLPHYDLAINTVRIGQEMLGARGFQVDQAQFGLDRDGARMFGVVAFANGVEGMGLAIGFRNSYDKSMSAGFAIGGRIFVCDNLVLAGELVVVRRHTGGIIEELRDRLVLTFHQAHQTWDCLVEDRGRMQALALTDDRAHEILGRAFGQGLIAPKQFLRVSREWRALVQSDMDITLFKNNLLRGLHQKKLLDGEPSVDHAQGYSRNFLGGKVHPKEIVDHPISVDHELLGFHPTDGASSNWRDA